MKKIAHCIHHTHWDLIWYFSVQDATVQFSYNMKEMLDGFRTGRITNFFLDGQTVPIDEYITLHPEDEDYIKELISEKKLVIGPFQSQLDCFICNGESVVNNLRLGIKKAKELGNASKVAYLPDSFGHSYDFPKIFNQFGIKDFVITRGVGDHYDLGSEFYMESNDGSQILVYTMIAGYGYGCYPFKNKTLFDESATDYNKISVHSLIDRLLDYSTIENEFVFPLGFDQNPAMLDIPKRIAEYNSQQDEIEFKQTTWEDFFKTIREKGKDIKTHKDELFSTQYHRVHKSIFSARADIKALQDMCERLLTYELQPLMAMLDSLGIEYDHGLIDKAWDTLLKCQTHSSATLTDETNDYIERETKNALQLAQSSMIYLMKIVALSTDNGQNEIPIYIFNTIPYEVKRIQKMKVFSRTPNFSIYSEDKKLSFTVVNTVKKNCGVLRKNIDLIDDSKFYYESDIILETEELPGICYRKYSVVDEGIGMKLVQNYDRFIENKYYKIHLNENGLCIEDKLLSKKIEKSLWIEESGDEGDSFDYSYPNYDLKITDDLSVSKATYHVSDEIQWMEINGNLEIPYDLNSRKLKKLDSKLEYVIKIELYKDSKIIHVSGHIKNEAEQHRVRFVIKGDKKQDYSYAGTQYGIVKRETNPKELAVWKEENWFEEPSPTFPILNHVTRVGDIITTLYTRGLKEYEFVNEGNKDIALTVFRSYGAMGYPDLNRRPGRPSGLDYMIFETPKCQMKKENTFDFGISYFNQLDFNQINKEYVLFASDLVYYQKQDFDKSLNPISYFPTNSLDKVLPSKYDFVSLGTSNVGFGSLVKADNSNSYILRVYNNDNQNEIEMPLIHLDSHTLSTIDLEENKTDKNPLSSLNKGELRNIQLIKEEK